MPSISVIATVLNEADEIGGLLASLRQQTLPPTEVVIVDGGSTDGTWERLVHARRRFPALLVIRDESCSLRHCPGPIARGRNVAIRAAHGDVIACADGGCRYDADWLERLTEPLRAGSEQSSGRGPQQDSQPHFESGRAEYVLGGSRLDLQRATVWDLAAAPFLGVKLAPGEPTKSCTARSMAFTREAWKRTGGFPESLFIGEDVLFDQQMRRRSRTAFAAGAKAIYTPRNSFASALRQVRSYAVADGIAGLRPARLMRHLFRCMAEALAITLLVFSVWPLLLVALLEVYFAYRLDWRQVRLQGTRALGARLVFSLLVPWVVAWNQVVGSLRKQYRTNRQNAA